MKRNKINRVLDQLCAHIALTRPWQPREDDEMNEMTLPCRKTFRNSSSGGEHATFRSRSFLTILNHYEGAEKKHFVFLKLKGQSGA